MRATIFRRILSASLLLGAFSIPVSAFADDAGGALGPPTHVAAKEMPNGVFLITWGKAEELGTPLHNIKYVVVLSGPLGNTKTISTGQRHVVAAHDWDNAVVYEKATFRSPEGKQYSVTSPAASERLKEVISTPTPVVAKLSTKNGVSSVTWIWPASTGGRSELKYGYVISPSVKGCGTNQTTKLTFTCVHLHPNTAYSFSVAAITPKGDSSDTGQVNVTTN